MKKGKTCQPCSRAGHLKWADIVMNVSTGHHALCNQCHHELKSVMASVEYYKANPHLLVNDVTFQNNDD